jgi:HD-GYP domain-containing protein (c-di-GMP phosphodiesterase class II)
MTFKKRQRLFSTKDLTISSRLQVWRRLSMPVCLETQALVDREVRLSAIENDEKMWTSLATRESALALVKELDPGRSIVVDEGRLDSICEAFGEIIDAKSPYTQRHSKGVAEAAVSMATALGLSGGEITMCRRAALLHDLGKLGVLNTILDKPSKLDAHEWDIIRMHPFNTHNILDRIPHFQEIAFIASSHHEKLDGSGYHRGISGEELPLAARIMAVADIFDALGSARPYRKALETEEVDASCYEALKQSLGALHGSE